MALHIRSIRRSQRGATTTTTIAILVIVILLAAAAWFLILRPPQHAVTAAVQAARKPVATVAMPAVSANRLETMSVDQLLAEARKALAAQRLVAPAGDNAVEYYVSVLAKDPKNRDAQGALREIFPFAEPVVEQAVNQGNLDEAQREIDLLAKADPNNYTLTILRAKLDAARKLASSAQQQKQQALAKQQAAQQQQLLAAQQAAAARQAAETAAKPVAEAPHPAAVPAAAAPKPVAAAPAAAENRDAQITRMVPPKYPLQAARDNQQGWVEVEFTVTTDGRVSNAQVVDAQPRRVFDRAAIEAVSRWQFKPALINGTPTAVVLKRKLEFKLGGG
ncbi:MAG TPA: energy transducer TonB [Rhodanobacteraceae bacterium]|nr:energy transducer TonB [Rhodanobacteraceae bacterium]